MRQEELLRGVSYKPGWRFELHEALPPDCYHPLILVIYVETLDARDGTSKIRLQFQRHIHRESVESRSLFLEELRVAIWELETHELREWLRVDGVPLEDPHPGQKELLHASETKSEV